MSVTLSWAHLVHPWPAGSAVRHQLGQLKNLEIWLLLCRTSTALQLVGGITVMRKRRVAVAAVALAVLQKLRWVSAEPVQHLATQAPIAPSVLADAQPPRFGGVDDARPSRNCIL